MKNIEPVQELYSQGKDRRAVEYAVDENLITINLTSNVVGHSFEDLLQYVQPERDNSDPENYQALLTLLNTSFAKAAIRRDDIKGKITIPPDLYERVQKWHQGAIPAEKINLLKRRIKAFNENKRFVVIRYREPEKGEIYFNEPWESAAFLAREYGLSRGPQYRPGMEKEKPVYPDHATAGTACLRL